METNTMKKIFTLLLILAVYGLHAQTYNNEWIDYSKTYYKFKIGVNGLYRIPQNILSNAGLGSVPAQNFQLFRNGKEIPIYTSVTSGTLGSADYIEFYGEMNDGKPDKPLYYSPVYQHTTKWSLQTDTAVYFLTVNPTGNTFHYLNSGNDTSTNLLPVEPYFLYKAGSYFREQINPGFASYVGEYVYSSSYDMGEFWSTNPIVPGSPYSNTINNLLVYIGNGAPNATINFGAAGAAPDTRTMQVKVNNTIVKDTTMDNFNDLLSNADIPLSLIASNSINVQYVNNSPTGSDRMVASFYELTYPRQFNFGGQANFYFELAAKSGGYYLNITNFSGGSAKPVLYDITSGARYTAVVSSTGTLCFVIPGSPSSQRFILVSEDPANIQTVTGLTPKTFVNYANSANQGNYIIISNPLLYTGTTGNNPVNDYKTYRKTAAGGNFNAIAVDINELVDQFAFGIKKHPLSIKNFLNFARNTFAGKPQYVFLIGHGITYDQYRINESNPMSDLLDIIPTFGYPASDNKLSSADGVQVMPLTPIGRLSVISGAEIENYLQKVQEYEQMQQTSANTIEGRLWMKNVVHVTGASDPYLGAVLCNYMSSYQQIIQDTSFGGNVTTFCKSTPTEVDQISDQQLANLFVTGFSMLNYFGHSSASTLEFNLNDPTNYNNIKKYPVFYVNGCDAGDFFIFDPTRYTYTANKTLSESWVLAKEKGAVAFVASTHWGIVNYLNILLNGLYTYISKSDYGKSIGKIQADAIQNLVTVAPGDFYARLHAEEMTLHGDPALKLNGEGLPDYDVEASQVVVSPSFISVANTTFTVNAHFANLGKVVPDSISVVIKRTYPDGSSVVLIKKKIPGIRYMDSLQIAVPIVATRDKGQNYITVIVNADNNVAEVTTINNSTTVGIYIYEDEATPVYPYNYAIVNNQTQKLYASTANPLSLATQYVMQIDTTTLFNSPSLVSKNITQIGGILEFDPGESYRDSTVYYWRTSIVPVQGSQYHWNNSSFIYIDSNNSTVGFNQSHFYQHIQSTLQRIYLDSGSRKWYYGTINNSLAMYDGVFPTAASNATDFEIVYNGNTDSITSVCGYGIVFNVFDPVTFRPWVNALSGQPGRYGSSPVCGPTRIYNFQFSLLDTASRRNIMNFMDLIPDGYYVVVKNVSGTDNTSQTYAPVWAGDTSYLGSGNSIYNRLLLQGFTGIDSFNFPRAFIFNYQKNRQSTYPSQFVFSQGIYDKITMTRTCITQDTTGFVTSPVFGPAKKWSSVHWRGYSLETPSTDSVSVQVMGVDTAGNSTLFYNLSPSFQDFDISGINAAQYPFVQLKLNTVDKVNATPYQLKYWRLNYTPVPEGALAPNLFFTSQDTLNFGQQLQFGVAFKNISISAFDSMSINITVIDHNNVSHLVQLPKKRPLVSGDTLIVSYVIDTKAYPGSNTIYLDVNPNNAQPEQYHFNNFLYKNFYVRTDNVKPLLDVTFDGVHILNQDIVSAKPHITIKLKDESKFLLLTDTSSINVQLRYPDGTLHTYSFNSDTLRFTPATSTADNTATVDFYPAFTKQYNPEGDVYTLVVAGKDASGNPAGSTVSYQISFTIITKPMISNLLNYPNPFTTSTAFVFTVTGSQVPQNIKIQILTITGKIVREITEDELGPLHVGRNITEFKWNGTDMYGQRLANGVYIYHVVTNLNGKSLDKYTATSDNTDQYFTKGYGKMYLMR
jgi:hypothetical protein